MFRQVVALRPTLVQARHNLALTLASTGDLDGAAEQLLWMANHMADPTGPLITLAQLEAQGGRPNAARKHIAAAVERGGEQVVQRLNSDPLLGPLLPR